MTYVLIVLLFTNNAFYKHDAVPTIEFKTKESCESFAKELKKQTEVKTNYLCIPRRINYEIPNHRS